MPKHKVKQEWGVHHVHFNVLHMSSAVLSTYVSLTPSNLMPGHLQKHFFRLTHTYQQVLRSIQIQKLCTTDLAASDYEVLRNMK